ncbi:MAG: TRAM domain-containing protein [Halodesulfurarchaeum sp.]
MATCPLADDCPHFSEQIDGMGCQHYGDRGGMEWCKHYNQPIEELKTAPVVPGETVVVEVTDMHESGAGVGHHQESGFVIMVEGVLPEAWVEATVETVKSNYAQATLDRKLDEPPESAAEPEAEGSESESEAAAESGEGSGSEREEDPRLGSRENFWGS